MIDFAYPYSLDTFKSVFNKNNLELKDIIPITISFDLNKYIPSGSPGVVLKSSLLAAKENQLQSIQAAFPFPTKKGLSPGIVIDVNYKNLYLLPQKNLIRDHKIKIIDTFEKDKLRDIGNYVADNAAITFTFSNLKATSVFWESIPYLCSTYKYTTFFYHLAGGRKRESSKEEFIPFVSFIDLPYCIPVFDYRKIDGMGVCCGFVYKNGYEKDGEIIYTTNTIDTLYFILSNHQANILYMDGVKLGDSAKIDMNILSYMSHFIETETIYKKRPNLLGKVKKVSQKSDMLQGMFTDVKVESKNINITNAPIYFKTSFVKTIRGDNKKCAEFLEY